MTGEDFIEMVKRGVSIEAIHNMHDRLTQRCSLCSEELLKEQAKGASPNQLV